MYDEAQITEFIDQLASLARGTEQLNETLAETIKKPENDTDNEALVTTLKHTLNVWSGTKMVDSIVIALRKHEDTKKKLPHKVVEPESDISILGSKLDNIAGKLGDRDTATGKIQPGKEESSWLSSLFGPGSFLLLTSLASLVAVFMDLGGPIQGFLKSFGKWGTMGSLKIMKTGFGGMKAMFNIFIKPFKSLFGVGASAGSKIATKTGLRAIPFIGALFSFGFAIKEAIDGDYVGMSLDIVSGILNLIPTGITQVLSAGLDVFHGFLEYRNLTETDPVTGKGPGKGKLIMDILKKAGNMIGGKIMRHAHWIPVVGPLIAGGEAATHFAAGRNALGLDAAARCLSGLIPFYGPVIYEGLNFISELFTGGETDRKRNEWLQGKKSTGSAFKYENKNTDKAMGAYNANMSEVGIPDIDTDNFGSFNLQKKSSEKKYKFSALTEKWLNQKDATGKTNWDKIVDTGDGTSGATIIKDAPVFSEYTDGGSTIPEELNPPGSPSGWITEYNDGGVIAPGGLGIVGERKKPELVIGGETPTRVISTSDTDKFIKSTISFADKIDNFRIFPESMAKVFTDSTSVLVDKIEELVELSRNHIQMQHTGGKDTVEAIHTLGESLGETGNSVLTNINNTTQNISVPQDIATYRNAIRCNV